MCLRLAAGWRIDCTFLGTGNVYFLENSRKSCAILDSSGTLPFWFQN
jgi:hypothetical protein